MEEKKIVTTDIELKALIGVAAIAYSDMHKEVSWDYIADVAAGICAQITAHLTGKDRFPEVLVRLSRSLAIDAMRAAETKGGCSFAKKEIR